MAGPKRSILEALGVMAAGFVAGAMVGGGMGLYLTLDLGAPFTLRAMMVGGVLGMAGTAAASRSSLPLGRIIRITLGLMATGFVFGGLAGLVMMYAWRPRSDDILSGGLFGGMVGMALGPLVAWMLMRHVPLWLAVGGTTLGTVTGWLIGLWGVGYFNDAYTYAIHGFIASALLLRFATPRTRRRPLPV